MVGEDSSATPNRTRLDAVCQHLDAFTGFGPILTTQAHSQAITLYPITPFGLSAVPPRRPNISSCVISNQRSSSGRIREIVRCKKNHFDIRTHQRQSAAPTCKGHAQIKTKSLKGYLGITKTQGRDLCAKGRNLSANGCVLSAEGRVLILSLVMRVNAPSSRP
ncbi:hypothetical protein ACFE04_028243 [Oxalis oulophora]